MTSDPVPAIAGSVTLPDGTARRLSRALTGRVMAERCPLCQHDEASAERTRAQIEQARRALATALDTLQELLDR